MNDSTPAVPATIHIDGLRLGTVLGVAAGERTTEREVVIDVKLDVDIGPAAATDCLENAVDYTVVRDRIAAVVTGARYHLLESLAKAVLDAVAYDVRVRRAVVCVGKPRAMRMADAVAVSVEWTRPAEGESRRGAVEGGCRFE